MMCFKSSNLSGFIAGAVAEFRYLIVSVSVGLVLVSEIC